MTSGKWACGRTAGLVAIALGMLSGCDLAGRFDTPEARINSAIPIDPAITGRIERFRELGASNEKALEEFDRLLESRMKIRALTCASGYSPGWTDSEEEVRKQVGGKDCFEDADAGINHWVSMRLIGALMALPPLRPLPKPEDAKLSLPEVILNIRFAGRAGVAAVETQKAFYIVDVGQSKVLHKERKESPMIGRLSGNGRLFATSAAVTDTHIRDSETGDTLLELEGVRAYSLHWLDEARAIYTMGETYESVLADFNLGEEAPIDVIRGHVDLAVATPGEPDRYVIFYGRKVGAIEVESGDEGLSMSLVDEAECGGCTAAINTSTLAPDESTVFVSIQKGIARIDLETLGVEIVDFAPLRVGEVPASTSADSIVFAGVLPSPSGGSFGMYEYSWEDRQISRVGNPARTSHVRLQAWPAFGGVPEISSSRVIFHEELELSDPTGVQEFLDQAREAQLEANVADLQARQSQLAPGVRLPEVMNGPVKELAAGSRIEGVGVYEGKSLARPAPGSRSSPGTVTIIVRKTSEPLVLVLSSYEGVTWQVVRSPGAQLRAVLTSSYETPVVRGVDDVKIVHIGRHHAYEIGTPGYSELQANVYKWTGATMSLFQGSYTGGSFTVGGI